MRLSGDTIVAIATGSARAGIGIVRLSGPESFQIARKVFAPKGGPKEPWPSHELFYGTIVDADERIVDDGYAVRMAAPLTYTGEEVVEIQSHGSPIILQEIIEFCTREGARLAAPGEFTKRAFLNGKIDLVQAEAVAELINAESDVEAKGARLRLEGRLSGALDRLRQDTISVLAECEADVDFPEEGLSVSGRPTLSNKIEQIQSVATNLRKTYATNERIHRGFVVAIVGRPNVGKSSLFNALLNLDRAIVTPLPGTTRDVLREELILNGCRVRLVDTAGLHEASVDEIEKIGMERTARELKEADLVVLVLDATEGLRDDERRRMDRMAPDKMMIVWNKTDIKMLAAADLPAANLFKVSAKSGEGLERLREALGVAASKQTELQTDGGISNDRQLTLLDEYLSALERADGEIEKKASPEFVAFELRQAHRAISRMLGKDEGSEDILGEIFSRFCIGK